MSLYSDQVSILIDLMHSSAPISGNILSWKMAVGPKTLKKEIDLINDYCRDYGCEIVSKSGEGYYLSVYDNDLYEAFHHRVTQKYYESCYYRNEQSERLHLVIRLLLTNRKTHTFELADYCLCSESTLNRDMKRIRNRLKEYGLQLVGRPNHGLELVGSEWKIRIALLSEYAVYCSFENVQHFEHEKDFSYMFLHGGIYVDAVKEKIIHALRIHDYRIPHYSINTLTSLFILTLSRHKYRDELDAELLKSVDTSVEQEIVRAVCQDISEINMQFTETEILSIAVYLYLSKTIKYTPLLRQSDSGEILLTVDGFISHLNERFDICKYDISVFQKDLACELYRLFRQSKFHVHTTKFR